MTRRNLALPVGNRFGRLVVLGAAPSRRAGIRYVQVRCDCGVEKEVPAQLLLGGQTRSCGCIRRKLPVNIGDRFGRLTVIDEPYSRHVGYKPSRGVSGGLRVHSLRYVRVRCDCGTEKEVQPIALVKGGTQSCGCLRRELVLARFQSPDFIEAVAKLRRTHGMAARPRHPIYAAWKSMRTRCTNPDPHYKHWGGRGIGICKRWQKFENFFEDMAPTWRPGLTLDRAENDADYSPENCRWTTYKIQMRNRRLRRVVDTPKWGPIPLWLAAERSGIRYGTLHSRLRRGKPLFPPARG